MNGTLISISLALLPALQNPNQDPPTPVVDRGEFMELSFDETGEGITLEAFVKICQQVTDYNFTFTEDAKQNLQRKIRIFGKKRIAKSNFYQFFQTVMKIHDFVCVEMGKDEQKIIVIMDLRGQPQNRNTVVANAIYVDPNEVESYADQPGVLITTLFTLRYQQAQQVQASLRQHITDQTIERVFNVGSSGLVVTNYGPIVNSYKKLIQLIDVPPEKVEPPLLEVVPLEFAAAEEIEPILGELIERRRGPRAGGGRGPEGATAAILPEDEYEIKIIPDPRTSSLIVQASRSDMVWVLDLIQRLDTKLEVPESNFHIYPVKNVEAKVLAENLSKFLEQTQQAIQQAQSAPRAGGAAAAPAGQQREQKPVVIADEQTNSVLITASKTRWAEIKNLIDRLDVRQHQVLIETALVELTEADSFRLGFEIAKISGDTLPEEGEGKPAGFTNFGISNFSSDINGVPTGQNLLGEGGTPLAGNGLLAGYILGGEDITLPVILSTLKTRSNAKVLSIPSILVTNNADASITSTTAVQAQQNTTAANGQTIQGGGASDSAGITLNISPSISAADYLRLSIAIEVSTFTASSNPFVIPPKTSRTMSTSVFVPDGATLYIGGIVQDNSSESAGGVPILMDIPIIGALFRSESNDANKTTLYFFITPHIVREQDFSDLIELSYKRKLEANTIIGSDKIHRIDPNFVPLAAPTGETDMKELESSFFEVPLYRSPANSPEKKEKKEEAPK